MILKKVKQTPKLGKSYVNSDGQLNLDIDLVLLFHILINVIKINYEGHFGSS